jgi:hypothetical protein
MLDSILLDKCQFRRWRALSNATFKRVTAGVLQSYDFDVIQAVLTQLQRDALKASSAAGHIAPPSSSASIVPIRLPRSMRKVPLISQIQCVDRIAAFLAEWCTTFGMPTSVLQPRSTSVPVELDDDVTMLLCPFPSPACRRSVLEQLEKQLPMSGVRRVLWVLPRLSRDRQHHHAAREPATSSAATAQPSLVPSAFSGEATLGAVDIWFSVVEFLTKAERLHFARTTKAWYHRAVEHREHFWHSAEEAMLRSWKYLTLRPDELGLSEAPESTAPLPLHPDCLTFGAIPTIMDTEYLAAYPDSVNAVCAMTRVIGLQVLIGVDRNWSDGHLKPLSVTCRFLQVKRCEWAWRSSELFEVMCSTLVNLRVAQIDLSGFASRLYPECLQLLNVYLPHLRMLWLYQGHENNDPTRILSDSSLAVLGSNQTLTNLVVELPIQAWNNSNTNPAAFWATIAQLPLVQTSLTSLGLRHVRCCHGGDHSGSSLPTGAGAGAAPEAGTLLPPTLTTLNLSPLDPIHALDYLDHVCALRFPRLRSPKFR